MQALWLTAYRVPTGHLQNESSSTVVKLRKLMAYLYQAHSTIASDGQLLVIAEPTTKMSLLSGCMTLWFEQQQLKTDRLSDDDFAPGNIDASSVASLHNSRALGHVYRIAVDLTFDLIIRLDCCRRVKKPCSKRTNSPLTQTLGNGLA